MPLRVLEIGAGTGAVFEALSNAVPADKLAFTFTDISPAFVEAAEDRFTGLARCATLDIERAPETQGYANGTYDVVVAANVLHATKDLRASLRHAARLLAPNGLLLLLEAAERSNWSDLVFGLTPGWWRFADSDLRASHPLLSGERWQALLRERFAAAEIVASPGGGAQVLAIAQAPKAERETLVWEAPANLEPLALANAAVAAVQQALARPNPPALRLVTRDAQAGGQSQGQCRPRRGAGHRPCRGARASGARLPADRSSGRTPISRSRRPRRPTAARSRGVTARGCGRACRARRWPRTRPSRPAGPTSSPAAWAASARRSRRGCASTAPSASC